MAGTLASAALLPFTGRWIDRMALRPYALIVCAGLAVACLAAALAPSAGFLILVIFLLRQSGQGLASHVSVTAMVKYFRHNRGKAIALASLGHPLARAGMPVAAVALIAQFGWRATYAICAVLVVLVLAPSISWLLANGAETRLFDPKSARQRELVAHGAPDRKLGDLLREPFFYLVMPGIIAPSAIDTALFFHLLTIAAMKGWSPAWVTGGYAIYAIGVIIVSLLAGKLIDRVGAKLLLPVTLVPLMVGVAVLAYFDHPAWAWVFLAIVGIGSGIQMTVVPAMWADHCGPRHIGAVKSATATLSVFGSALGPPLMGWMLDADVTLPAMALAAMFYMAVASVLMWVACRIADR
jgi:MFS family permease